MAPKLQIKDYFLQGNPGQESKAIIEVNNTIWTSYSDGICILERIVRIVDTFTQ